MFLTRILLKKAKAKSIMVQMESAVSGHTFNKIRERLGDKLEFVRFDPWNCNVPFMPIKDSFDCKGKCCDRKVDCPSELCRYYKKYIQQNSLYREKKKVRSMK